MADFNHSRKIVQDGLVWVVDPANIRSYPDSGTTLFDLTPTGNDGTMINGVSHSGVGLDYDGIDDCTTCDSLVSTVGSDTKGTISLWMKPTATTPSSFEYVLTFGDTSGSDTRIAIYHETAIGRMEFFCRGNGSTNWQKHVTANPFSADTWVNVTLVQDGVSPQLYINGVAVTQGFSISNDLTAWFNTFNMANIDNLRLGCYNNNGSGDILHYDGSLGKILYYNRDLSAAEALQNWDAKRYTYE